MTTHNHPKIHRLQSMDKQHRPSSEAAHDLLQTVLRLGGGVHLGLLQALLQRSKELDAYRDNTNITKQFLLSKNRSSGYSPLHEAIYSGDLCRILLLLRHATGDSDRMTRRPMELLYKHKNVPTLMLEMATVVDNEGMTPAALLAARQRQELAACRDSITTRSTMGQRRGTSRSNSLYDELSERDGENGQNEFGLLSRAMREAQQRRRHQSDDSSGATASQTSSSTQDTNKISYGCEVFTFGRAHHCALGVVASNRRQEESDTQKTQQLFPQRVQAFAQDTVGRENAAVVVANAAYHTLTVTAAGDLYAFGLGKGGRLGTGDEKHCSTPVRVQGPLLRQVVVGVAAAENHSLCVTSSGHVYAFGSNRFGQLGISNSSDNTSLRCSPRRVDDLKHVTCVGVAAGARHSVALTLQGEVYVWGDNSAGQLGVSGRSSNTSSLQKVQRVDALWKATHGPKKAIAISASEQSTLILAADQRGLLGNSVYSWGHGNHVPAKVNFGSGVGGRPINPTAISCARYHNVAITADGEVYCWGLHADSLGTCGTTTHSRKHGAAAFTAPQLVTGMLPSRGGGKAVAVSAAENHSAVVTEDGHLWTFGDSYKPNVLGHEGVRWQPDPKRVPGVHRAVAVSAAKEHTVLLIGASFPALPTRQPTAPGSPIADLESLAARKIALHCDLFNVIPILVMAERTQTSLLLDYCNEFVERNLDAVLNVGQKSVMDCYLNEQLVGCPAKNENHRDGRHHPLVSNVLLAGSRTELSFGQDRLCHTVDWLEACEKLSQQSLVATKVYAASASDLSTDFTRSLSFSEGSATWPTEPPCRRNSVYSERCEQLVSNINLSSRDLAEEKLACLFKEVRAIRKRLGQISKLESDEVDVSRMTAEQLRKISRRPQLEADLELLKPAIEAVEKSLKKLTLVDASKKSLNEAGPQRRCENLDDKESVDKECVVSGEAEPTPVTSPSQLRCDICQISCPDEKSFELHINGRKHRNRTAQVLEEEKKKAATCMIEMQQKALLMGPSSAPPKVKTTALSPWEKKSQGRIKVQYALPPPPHKVTDYVASPMASPGKSLKDIMAEESTRQRKSAQKGSPPHQKSPPLKLAPGSATATKSFPWSTGKTTSVSTKSPRQLPLASASPMKSPPWSDARIVQVAPSTLSLTTPQSYSLGDFLPSAENVAASQHTGWKKSPGSSDPSGGSPAVSFRDIQHQEEHFKTKEDLSFGANGKWFIERRERAGSFKEIQSESTKEREERLFVEDQRRIEQQIYEDLALRKKSEAEQEKQRSEKRPAKYRSRTVKRNDGNRKNRSQIDDQGLVTTEQATKSGAAATPGKRQRKRKGNKSGSNSQDRN